MSYRLLRYDYRGVTHYTLQGQGEHEGTNLTLSYRDILNLNLSREAELKQELDRRFLLKHHDRLSQHLADDAENGQSA